MSLIDYTREPHSDIAFFDIKSFYASVECVERGLNPLTTSLCVMSSAANSKGLILASSPTFKRVFGKDNVGRVYDLPFDVQTRRYQYQRAQQKGIYLSPSQIREIESWAKRTLFVPPRMALYIDRNLKIQRLLQNFAPGQDIYPYSIDEGFIDLTKSLNYFVASQQLSRRHKLALVANRIQQQIWRETGLFAAIGMSNANPLLAKLALDNEAKKSPLLRANWSYEDVPMKVWAINDLTDFWGIGSRMARRLNKMGIQTIYDLAHANPDELKRELGIIGVQLYFHANGVDESQLGRPYRPKSKAIGNSQILPRDYHHLHEIEIVLAEMAEQVAIRLRRAQLKATSVSLYVGFSKTASHKSIQVQCRITPTQANRPLIRCVLSLFRQNYLGGPVRQIGIRYGGLINERYHIYSLFEDSDLMDKETQLDHAVDQIRQRFGHVAVLKANALQEGSRVRERSKLIGGHSAGGLEGLN
ncbi:Y-family DNA polymerase [Vaginisenegalia massiliensis]|uniref:Y-family DNA polymerase n=1 Tax=Vaginisenegalia massiliensis TaxID=2058294 RepID=UPI000F5281F9|nr:Y-family DNA polymerase [Vaginisenegalia massiliensis]